MDPVEFITLGKKIQNDTNYNPEARTRCFISRIYYGILHYFIVEFQIKNINDKLYHKDAIAKINLKDSTIGSLIVKIQGFRTKADYFLNRIINSNDLYIFKQTCKQIMLPYGIDI